MTQIIIRGVPQRGKYINYLKKHLPDAQVYIDSDTGNPNTYERCFNSFLHSLKISFDQPAIYLADDLILTEGFREKIEKEIESKPDAVINFFSMRKNDVLGSYWSNIFSAGLCFYLPAGYPSQLIEYAEIWPRRSEHPGADDYCINDFLKTRKEKHFIVCPNLVDHLPIESAINKRRSKSRQSTSFANPIPF